MKIWTPEVNPKEFMPTDSVILVKGIDVDSGKMVYREYISPDLHPVEALGMVTTASDTLREAIMRSMRQRGDG